MPKKSGRGRILKPKIDETLALSTLAAATLISSDLSDNVDEESFLLSTECVYAIRGATAGEGPIIIGWAHNDYTDAEIEAWVELSQGWTRGDLVAMEIQKRKIRQVGIFANQGTDEILNDGKPLKTPMKFTLVSAKGLALWAYNASGAQLATGQVVTANGHAWLKF